MKAPSDPAYSLSAPCFGSVDASNALQAYSAPSVGMKVGARRCFVACSYAYAILINVGSLYARPKNEIPIGSPCEKPAGTLMFG